MTRSAADQLILFVKNPIAGRVKTRLAAELGEPRALAIYRRLLAHTRRLALQLDVHRLLYYSDFVDEQDDWPAGAFEKRRQEGTDLGQRMLHAFQAALKPGRRAVIIGSDCPGLRAAHLRTAFEQLHHHPFVIGPATDGGYYLLGMTRPEPALFEGIPWSTDQVAQHTLDRIRAFNQSCYLLPPLSDIDYAEDWEQHSHLLQEDA